jgi:PAS domain S-box-containing protein
VWLQRGGLVSKVVKDLVSRVQGTDEALTLNPSAEQLRGFIDSIPTLAWSAASDGAAESFNQRWLDYTGLSASEGLGWGWKAAIHPDDLTRLLDAFQRARESGQPFEFEGRLRRFDGEFRRFLMPRRPGPGRTGKRRHVVRHEHRS